MEPYDYSLAVYRMNSLQEKACRNERILFTKELLCYSVEGRRIEMLTITSTSGVDHNTQRMSMIPGMLPESSPEARPFNVDKPIVVILARTHPA